jgi:hypothetical protein
LFVTSVATGANGESGVTVGPMRPSILLAFPCVLVTLGACSSTDPPLNCPPTELPCSCPDGRNGVQHCGSATCDCDATPASDAGFVQPDTGLACLAAGSDCRGKENDCCNGTVCVFDTANPSKAVCAASCLNGSQCNTGCCTTLIEGTAAVCAPTNYCAGSCAKAGESCSSTTCCPNTVCVTSTVTGVSCAARCANHSQCASGCCAPLDNTGELVCSPATFCL